MLPPAGTVRDPPPNPTPRRGAAITDWRSCIRSSGTNAARRAHDIQPFGRKPNSRNGYSIGYPQFTRAVFSIDKRYTTFNGIIDICTYRERRIEAPPDCPSRTAPGFPQPQPRPAGHELALETHSGLPYVFKALWKVPMP